MVVGIGVITLGLHGCTSLKEKRGILKRVIERTRNKFNMSLAEVAEQDSHDTGIIGFCIVANDGRFINSVIDKMINFVDDLHLAELVDQEFELLHY